MAFGISAAAQAPGVLFAPPLGGLMRDLTGKRSPEELKGHACVRS